MDKFVYGLSRYTFLCGIVAAVLMLALAALLLLAPNALICLLRYGFASVLLIAAFSTIFSLMAALLHEITLETVLNYTPDKPFLAALVMLGLFALKSILLVIYSGLLYAASGIVLPLPLAILVNIFGTFVMVAVHYVPAHRIGAARV